MTDSGGFVKVPNDDEEERMRKAAEESQRKREEARKKREMEEAMKKAGEDSQRHHSSQIASARTPWGYGPTWNAIYLMPLTVATFHRSEPAHFS
uniref:Stress response protein NST1 n=1 Tax=Talaromyces marneffei PM1 TaxID=1077442 RepID=A0A093V1L6_TALMA